MENKPLYLDTEASPRDRAEDLVSRMTLDEKIAQTVYKAGAVARLGVPDYNWWNEGLHGVARAGIATSFPQAIGMAATFDAPAVQAVGDTISTEARAKYNVCHAEGDNGIYKGLTMWSPNVNIFRDPRWGRGHETYGEDPYLTGRMGVAFVKGLQGNNPKYLKTVATPKHFAVHSGPEALRHTFDACVSKKDLYETYLPAFKECIQEGGAYSIMGAYNRVYGEPCCGSKLLLQDILRKEWGFDGYVVSDCGAVSDFHNNHRVTADAAESAALAVKNGCDLNCGFAFTALHEAVDRGLITEEEISRSVVRLMEARIRLGMFDDGKCPYDSIPYEVVDCPAHREQALNMSVESMVLLKNNGILPLKEFPKSVAVIGPNADKAAVMLGNYNGEPSKCTTLLEAIRSRAGKDCKVWFNPGCDITTPPESAWGDTPVRYFAESKWMAEHSDIIILCLGLTPDLEGEEGSVANSDGNGDKVSVELPEIQIHLLNMLAKLGKPIITVMINGSAVAMAEVHEKSDAVLEAWYPGQDGGEAAARIIFGEACPAGRLPVTFMRSMDQVPPFTDYSMKGRTYRYMDCEPFYPFGYGLSYTSFEYGEPVCANTQLKAGESLEVTFTLTNTGDCAGDEVTEFYLKDCAGSVELPRWSLKGFLRTALEPGESAEIGFTLTAEDMMLINEEGESVLEPGEFLLYIGGRQPDDRSAALTGTAVKQVGFRVE